MRDTGTVTETDGTFAVVAIRPHGGCDSCASRHYCDPGDGKKGTAVMRVRSMRGVVPGDRVEVALAPAWSVLASFTVFGMPLVAAVMGYAVGTAGGAGQERGALFSVGAVALTFCVYFVVKKFLPATVRFMPRIVRKL